MTETWDNVNEQVKADWKDDTTPFERVYEIVEQTHDASRPPRSPTVLS